jgi:peptidoglycan/LPS O-acetylase OafA/YrhL
MGLKKFSFIGRQSDNSERVVAQDIRSAPAARHANNFQALRWIAASLVIFAHAHGLRGIQGEYLHITGLELGWSAVVMFFTISGYLISASVQRHPAREFWKARFLRIFPGLIICTLITGIVISQFSTLSFTSYVTHHQTLRYIFGTGTLLSTEYSLPGAFQHNITTIANGSLWTLRYEIASYFTLFMLFIVASGTGIKFANIIIVCGAACAVGCVVPIALGYTLPVQASNLLALFVPFSIGAWFQATKNRPPNFITVVLALAISAVLGRMLGWSIFATASVAIVTLWVAFAASKLFGRLNALPDYSYGIYIYGYPVQQMTSVLLPSWNPIVQLVVSFSGYDPACFAILAFYREASVGAKVDEYIFNRSRRCAIERSARWFSRLVSGCGEGGTDCVVSRKVSNQDGWDASRLTINRRPSIYK